jgi:hypothetical protein
MLGAIALGGYAKNAGRSYMWAAVPFVIIGMMQLYDEIFGGGPTELMQSIFAFIATGLLYFISAQATVAHEREKGGRD